MAAPGADPTDRLQWSLELVVLVLLELLLLLLLLLYTKKKKKNTQFVICFQHVIAVNEKYNQLKLIL